MAAFSTLANGKGAAVTSGDALNFVFSMTLFQPSGKDQDSDLIHTPRAPFKSR